MPSRASRLRERIFPLGKSLRTSGEIIVARGSTSFRRKLFGEEDVRLQAGDATVALQHVGEAGALDHRQVGGFEPYVFCTYPWRSSR